MSVDARREGGGQLQLDVGGQLERQLVLYALTDALTGRGEQSVFLLVIGSTAAHLQGDGEADVPLPNGSASGPAGTQHSEAVAAPAFCNAAGCPALRGRRRIQRSTTHANLCAGIAALTSEGGSQVHSEGVKSAQ